MSPREEAREAYGYHDRFTLPLDHGAALGFYIKQILVPHSRREMVIATAARVSTRVGRTALGLTGGKRPKRRLPAVDPTVRRVCKRLAETCSMPKERISLMTIDDYGHSKRGKTVVFIFGQAGGEPRLVAKMSASDDHVATLRREHDVLCSLREKVGDPLRDTLPEPLAVASEEGQVGFAESYMPGRSMYVEMRNSWTPRRHVERHFGLARDWLLAFQTATRAGEDSLDGRSFAEGIARSLEEYEHVFSPPAGDRQFIAEILRKSQALKAPRLPLVASQGDFWARNLIVNGAGLGVLDWENYKERGSPFFDLFLFMTSYGLNYAWKLGCWADPEAAFRATFDADGWMARTVRKYLLDYCARAQVSRELLEVSFAAFLAQRAIDEHKSVASVRGGREESGGDETVIARYGGVAAKGEMWRKLFQVNAQMVGRTCFG